MQLLAAALAGAEAFRARWMAVMEAAGKRFAPAEPRPAPTQKKSKDWSRYESSADVKVRGLARSFRRDGVMLFRAEQPLLTPELQAQVIDAFGCESGAPQPHPFSQPVAMECGREIRGYPLLMSLDGAREIGALPTETGLDDWLALQRARIQDVPVADPCSLRRVHSAEDYEEFNSKFKNQNSK